MNDATPGILPRPLVKGDRVQHIHERSTLDPDGPLSVGTVTKIYTDVTDRVITVIAWDGDAGAASRYDTGLRGANALHLPVTLIAPPGFKMVVTPGFKKYLMVVTPDGQLLMPESCSVIEVDIFSQKEFEAAMRGDARLDDTKNRFGARDLKPLLNANPLMREGIEQLRSHSDHMTRLWEESQAEVQRLQALLDAREVPSRERCEHCQLPVNADGSGHDHECPTQQAAPAQKHPDFVDDKGYRLAVGDRVAATGWGYPGTPANANTGTIVSFGRNLVGVQWDSYGGYTHRAPSYVLRKIAP